MHLLYLDESCSASDPSQQYFVLAGVSVFEREGHWIEQELNNVAKRFAPLESYSVELHGSPMRSGHGQWRRHSKEDRLQAIKDAWKVGGADRRQECSTVWCRNQKVSRCWARPGRVGI